MKQSTPHTGFRLSEEDLAVLWKLATDNGISQRAVLSIWIRQTARERGWDVGALVEAYRAHRANKKQG